MKVNKKQNVQCNNTKSCQLYDCKKGLNNKIIWFMYRNAVVLIIMSLNQNIKTQQCTVIKINAGDILGII